MNEESHTLLVLNKAVEPETESPARPIAEQTEAGLNIWVVFTSMDLMLSALKEAGRLAGTLGARITILVPQIVPFPVPLESPPVLLDWNERRFRLIAEQSPVETTVRIYLCRDRLWTLESVLNSRSVVVVGSRKTRWPTWERRLARRLRKRGHEVIVAETE
jgi:hypothetical protein